MNNCVITVNDKPLTIAVNTSIETLLSTLDIPNGASAIAVNQNIISRKDWQSTVLNQGDEIALFQAIAGG